MAEPASGTFSLIAIGKWLIAFIKSELVIKLATMFATSAFGAGLIAAYHPDTRKETWWRALGAGIGGVLIAKPAVLAASHYLPWLTSGDRGVETSILFVIGALFWGLVGALQNLQKRIKDKGGQLVADKIGLGEPDKQSGA